MNISLVFIKFILYPKILISKNNGSFFKCKNENIKYEISILKYWKRNIPNSWLNWNRMKIFLVIDIKQNIPEIIKWINFNKKLN